MRRQNRNSQTLNGKINRQNDLLAFLMNQVQKLERKLEAETAENKFLKLNMGTAHPRTNVH